MRALVRAERRPGPGRGTRRHRLGRLHLPADPYPARRIDRHSQRARLSAAFPARALRHGRRADARARLVARRLDRATAQRPGREGHRYDRRDDPRGAADALRCPLPHRRIARGSPSQLGHRSALGAYARAPRASAAAAAGAGACVRAVGLVPPAAQAGGARRRRPRLPRSRLGVRPLARSRAHVRRRRRRHRGHADRPLRDRRGAEARVPPSRSEPAQALGARHRAERGGEQAHGGSTASLPLQLRYRGDDRRSDLRAARHPVRAPARPGNEGREGGRAPRRPLLRARHHRDPHPRADPG